MPSTVHVLKEQIANLSPQERVELVVFVRHQLSVPPPDEEEFAAIEAGEAQIDQGEFVTHEQLMEELRRADEEFERLNPGWKPAPLPDGVVIPQRVELTRLTGKTAEAIWDLDEAEQQQLFAELHVFADVASAESGRPSARRSPRRRTRTSRRRRSRRVRLPH